VAKGHWEVVKAYRKARILPASCLVINGNRPSEFLLRKIVRSLRDMFRGYPPLSILIAWVNITARLTGNQKQIKLVDLPRERLISLYRGADLFVFAPQFEYSPRILSEAVSAGTPFISSDVANAREIAAWTGLGTIVDNIKSGRAEPKILDYSALTERLESKCNSTLGAKLSKDDMFQRFRERELTWDQIAKSYWAIVGGSPFA